MFGADFRTAELDGGTVDFTVAESRLLEVFASNPGRTLTRGQILDAISGHGSEKNDRSVDFLINRVRRKLGDNARDPQFIATRYGGGYVWLGPVAPARPAEPVSGADAMIGPLRGLDNLGPDKAAGPAFAQFLAEALGAETGRAVAVDLDLDPASLPATGTARFTIELSFFRDAAGSGIVLACRSRPSGQVFLLQRLRLIREGAPFPSMRREAERMAPDILSARWRLDTDQLASSEPLPVAMQNAALNYDETPKSAKEIAVHLARLREEHPDDPRIALMYANHLHTRIVYRGRETFLSGFEESRQIDREIEDLVQGALVACRDKPELAIMAAKLLYYVDRNYKPLALELAENALAQSTAIASSMAILGQLRAFWGDIDAAVDVLRQAEALAAPKSRFRHYVQFFLCQALIAAGRREELEPVRAELYGFHPLARLVYESAMTDADKPSLRARGVMLTMSKRQAAAFLRFIYHIQGRLFELPEHRANSLRTPITLAMRRFGRSVVPDEVARSVPLLFE